MKNKIRFILPKLIGATVLVGLLSFVIGLLFKLLLVGTVLFAAGAFIISKMRNKKSRKMLYEHKSPISPASRTDYYTAPDSKSVEVKQSNLAIIPIH